MNEDMHDEFIWAVEEAVTQNLSLSDEIGHAAAESDGDLQWLYDYVAKLLQDDREDNTIHWAHLPASEPLPGDAIWEAVEHGVDWVRRFNPTHAVVISWDKRGEQNDGH